MWGWWGSGGVGVEAFESEGLKTEKTRSLY